MKKNVLFVVDELKYGGVSKVLCDLLKFFDYTRFNVHILALHKHGEFVSRFPENVQILGGSPFFSIVDQRFAQLVRERNVFGIARKIRMALLIKSGWAGYWIRRERKKFLTGHYDVEIAFKDGFCTLFVAAGNTGKKISWIHSDYSVRNFSGNYMGAMKRALAEMDEHIAVARTAAAAFQKVFSLKICPSVIHNCLDTDAIRTAAGEPVTGFSRDFFNIVSVGRISEPKGYDRLARVHARLIARGLWHRIHIVGSGEEFGKLQSLVEELGIGQTFLLLGYQSNPYPYIQAADLYVSSSNFEGYATSVLEALILKVPVLATDVSGIREQLAEGRYGKIVENSEEALFEGMAHLLENRNECARYRKCLEDYTYDNQSIVNQICERF